MYCIHCGKWTEGTQEVCPDCAAKLQTSAVAPEAPAYTPPPAPAYAPPAYTPPAAPAYAPPAYTPPAAPTYAPPAYTPPAAPAYAPPAYTPPAAPTYTPPVYTPPAEPAYPPAPSGEDSFQINAPQVPEKKKNGKLIGLICGLAAVVVVALLVVFNWDAITGLFGKTHKTPAQHLQQVDGEALSSSVDSLTDAYSQYLTAAKQGPTATSGQMHLLLGDEVISLLESAMEEEGIPLDIDWLSDIRFTGTFRSSNDAFQMMYGIGLGDTTILTADILANAESDEVWLGFPELHGDYLYFDSFAEITGMSIASMMATPEAMSQEILASLPEPEVLNTLLKKYGNLLIDHMENVEEGKQTVTQGQITQEFTTLTVKLTPQELVILGEDLLKELQQDPQAQDVLVSFATTSTNISYDYPYVTEGEMAWELTAAIEESLEELAVVKEDMAQETGYLLITTYLDEHDRICGRSLTLMEEETSEPMEILRFLTTHSGDQFALEAVVEEELQITGSGTEANGILSGSFFVNVEGQQLLQLQLENMSEEGGKLRLIPSKPLLEEILYEMDLEGSGLLSSMDLLLEMEVHSTDTSDYVSMMLMVDDELLIGITVSITPMGAGGFTVPSTGVDVMDDAAGAQWIREMDFGAVLKNMTAAGVPSDLVELMNQLFRGLKASMSGY